MGPPEGPDFPTFGHRRISKGGRVMRWIFLSIIAVVVVQLALASLVEAEDVTGCPLGLKRGELWFKAFLKSDDMTKRYDRGEDGMVDMLSGEHNRVHDVGVRLGYGMTDRWDVGLFAPLRWVDRRVYNKKAKEWVEVESHGIQGVWLASRYKFYYSEDTGVFDEVHLNVGAGIKFPLSSSAKIKEGIGNGASEFRLVFLSHETVGRLSFCNHLLYNWRGEASDISGWNYSGQDLTDRINYKFNLEFDLLGSGVIETSAGLVGWFDVEEVELAEASAGCALDGRKACNHAVAVGIELKPWGERYDHRKFTVKVRIPYEVKSSYAPDYTLTAVAMMTFEPRLW
jgi:hypothetical protein